MDAGSQAGMTDSGSVLGRFLPLIENIWASALEKLLLMTTAKSEI